MIGAALARFVSANDEGRGDVCGPDHIARIAYDAAEGPGELWFELGDVPPSRGLGFSAAARAAGAVLARLHAGDDLDAARARAYEVVFDLEGHGDNAAPAVFGGTHVIVGRTPHRLPDSWPGQLGVWVPDTLTTLTDESRACLDPQVARADAIFNLGRFGLLIHALHTGELGLLREATADRLHQDCRFESNADSAAAVRAALEAGAAGAWLSGSGPTVAFITEFDDFDRVAAALPGPTVAVRAEIDPIGATTL